jgi:peptidylprolyl isomerase
MAKAKNGDMVKVHYRGTLDDGTVFDESTGKDPLEFKLGERNLIPAFEEAVLGLSPGEKKTVKVAAKDAYGEVEAAAIIRVERTELPQDMKPVAGLQLQMMDPDGNAAFAVITEVDATHVTIDGNHPLAGKDLIFEIELVSVA